MIATRRLLRRDRLTPQGGPAARTWRSLGVEGESGAAMIETAIALSILLSLAFWLFEMSLFVYTLAVLDDAAHEGVRYAIAHGADSSNCSGPTTGCTDLTGANVKAVVVSVAASSLQIVPASAVTVSYPDLTAHSGSLVTVAISYPYVPFFKSVGLNQTAKVSAQGRIVF